MDRKALAVVIIFLSSLVVLYLLNFNPPASAPAVSPSPQAHGTTIRPSLAATLSAKVNTSNVSITENATASPTTEPVAEVAYAPPQAHAAESSPSPQPTESVAMQPWQPMPAWSPMPKASPLGWSDTLMKKG